MVIVIIVIIIIIMAFFSPLELDVLVDEDGNAHGDQGEEDAGHEHDAEAGHPSQDGERPGEIILRSPYSILPTH